MLINGQTPILINQCYLGNDNCMALLLSGHAVSHPLMVNDIADALYWLQVVNSLLALWCTDNIIVKNLLQVCVVDEDHIHPLQVHYELAEFATYVLF